MMMRTSALLLSLLALAPGALGQVSSCDQCKFDGSDASDCKVYGQLGDDKLIAWNQASQACLDEFKIKDQAVDPELLKTMFPNSDGTGGNIPSFVNYLRFNDGAVEQGLKASLPDFFVESTQTTPAKVVLRDTITVSGTSYNCASSVSSCWTALRTYFGTTAGAAEMTSIGRNLYATAANSREKEQSFARIRLCSDGATSTCGDLSTQVQEVKAANAGKFCSAFGLGPAENRIPGCDGTSGSPSGSGSPPAGSAAAAGARPAGVLAALGAAALALVAVL